ncbi:putative disease resistance protein [Vitis vinifera]|uniref:Putative disease resistance protein n=1 Tax=Vitis vinifera TaxID=29760 RepID=A0A438I8G9_VITVI|nr:putative disease resistance protein [Vitis vinifera]
MVEIRKAWRAEALRVCGCDGLVSLEEPALPCSLEYLEIQGCENLESCQMNCKVSGWPPMLRELEVDGCEGIKALPGDWMMMRMDGDNTNSSCVLERVEIRRCPSLLFFPKGELPTSLKQLIIRDCENVKSLPEGIMRTCNLEKLIIQGCSSLTSFPSGELPSTLKDLVISNCGNLELPPDHMPNLTALRIKGCKGLKHHHLQNLTSLEHLSITGCPSLESFREGVWVSPQLESCCNCQLIWNPWPPCLSDPHSLEDLCIWDCPKLQQFLPKEGLPATLGWLEIRGCPIIEKRCLKDGGEDWPHIAHIPIIRIGRN